MNSKSADHGNAIARMIDHALLHPTMTDAEMREGCRLAGQLGVASVCVKPYAIPLAVEELRDTATAVGTVIGFPHGSCTSEVKAFEAEQACAEGASELDMVVNIGKAIEGDWDYVERDIRAVVEVGKKHDAVVKVIFETDFVTDAETKRKLCELCERVGADFVKTSTGFGFTKQSGGDYAYQGATEDDIKLMRDACSDATGVKASGGIRSYEDARKFCDLGATRLGTSASQAIIDGAGTDQTSY